MCVVDIKPRLLGSGCQEKHESTWRKQDKEELIANYNAASYQLLSKLSATIVLAMVDNTPSVWFLTIRVCGQVHFHLNNTLET